MNEFEEFIHKTYTVAVGSRVPVKDIYQEFHAWLLEHHGMKAANSITQREVCAALKLLPDYVYVRYAEGYCLRGCTRILISEAHLSEVNLSEAHLPKLALNVVTQSPKSHKECKPGTKPRIVMPRLGQS